MFTADISVQASEVPLSMTCVNLQGKPGCKYVINYSTTFKPRRIKHKEVWPTSPEENLERLKDTGEPLEQTIPVCHRCKGKSIHHRVGAWADPDPRARPHFPRMSSRAHRACQPAQCHLPKLWTGGTQATRLQGGPSAARRRWGMSKLWPRGS